jgi:surface protein
MTIANEINRLNNAKAAIKQSIENKGVTVSDTAKLDEYPALINSITVGSGSGGEGGDCDCEYINPDFFELITHNNTSYRGLFFYYSPKTDLDLSMFDSSNVTDMSYMFERGFIGSSGKLINFKSLDFSKVKTINYMFNSCYITGAIDLSGISFPELTDAKSIFYSTSNITAIDMSNVDMPKVTDASSMFYVSSSNKMTSLNLTGINMPNLTNASSMFYYCNKITSLDVSGINFSKVTNANNLFYQCTTLVDVIGEIDFSNLTSGIYSSSTSNIFRYCAALETVYLKNIYKDVTTMKNEAKWSINLADTKVKDECLIYMINELPDLINDKGLTTTNKIVLTLPTINTLTAEQVQPAIDKGWTVANTNY